MHFETFTLANGLRCIVHPDPTVSKVAVNILYRVGAKHEQPHRTGFAHLFEHLMFEGSKHIPRYDEPVERAGGTNNAFTTNDLTNYYLVLPAHALETAFWLESDRMLELAFSEERLAVQKSVVIEEFKQRYLNQPYGDAYLHLRPLMFTTHPYRWMTIGEKIEHIETATLAEVQAFFYQYYAPDNATLVVAGGVAADDVKRLAEKWFGPIPARTVQKPPLPAEPPQTAARRTEVSGPVPHTMVYKAWHIPARAAADYLPAELWAEILTGGRAGRLYTRLVKETEVASSVGAFSWQLHDTGQFSLNARLAPGRTVDEYERILAEALAELTETTPDELQRQQTKLAAEESLERTAVSGRALSLALYDSFADPSWVNTEPGRLQALTLADLHAFRERYFVPTNCSTLVYGPEN